MYRPVNAEKAEEKKVFTKAEEKKGVTTGTEKDLGGAINHSDAVNANDEDSAPMPSSTSCERPSSSDRNGVVRSDTTSSSHGTYRESSVSLPSSPVVNDPPMQVQQNHLMTQSTSYVQAQSVQSYVAQTGRMRIRHKPIPVFSKVCAAEVYDPMYAPFRRNPKTSVETIHYRMIMPCIFFCLILFPLFYLILSYLFQVEWPVALIMFPDFDLD